MFCVYVMGPQLTRDVVTMLGQRCATVYDAGSTLGQRLVFAGTYPSKPMLVPHLRRWPNSKPALVKRVVFPWIARPT